MARGSRQEAPDESSTGMQVQVPTAFLGVIKDQARARGVKPRDLALAVVHAAMVSMTPVAIAAIALELKRQSLQAELAALGKAAE